MSHSDPYNIEEASPVSDWLVSQFSADMTKQVYKNESLKNAMHTFYHYVRKNQSSALDQFHALHFYEPDDFLMLDPSTQKNLEIIKNCQDGSRKHTLFSVVDRAATSMGSRMVKKWLTRPLVKRGLRSYVILVLSNISELIHGYWVIEN